MTRSRSGTSLINEETQGKLRIPESSCVLCIPLIDLFGCDAYMCIVCYISISVELFPLHFQHMLIVVYWSSKIKYGIIYQQIGWS
jgi:hypothetical protein